MKKRIIRISGDATHYDNGVWCRERPAGLPEYSLDGKTWHRRYGARSIALSAVPSWIERGGDNVKNPSAVALGRLGGMARSPSKTRAVRKNAKLGGWPLGRRRKTIQVSQ